MCPYIPAFTVSVLSCFFAFTNPTSLSSWEAEVDGWANFGNKNSLSQKQMKEKKNLFYGVHFPLVLFFPPSSECAFSCFFYEDFCSLLWFLCWLSGPGTAEVTVSLDSTELFKELRQVVSTACSSVGKCEGSSQP